MNLEVIDKLSNEILFTMFRKIQRVLAEREVNTNALSAAQLRKDAYATLYSEKQKRIVRLRLMRVSVTTCTGLEVDETGRELNVKWKVPANMLTPELNILPENRTIPIRNVPVNAPGGEQDKPASMNEGESW